MDTLQQSPDTGNLIHSGNKINNIELLRFIFAWAVVGFHASCGAFDTYRFAFLNPYLYAYPCSSVPMFFIIAFFFLIIHPRSDKSLWNFCISKWIRLAPLLIITTLAFYLKNIIITGSLSLMNLTGNIENILLIQDWASVIRYDAYVGSAWWCATYLLIAVFYVILRKALPNRYTTLVIATISYIGWRIYILRPCLPSHGTIVGHYQIGLALFCLGLGYAISRAPSIPPAMLKNKQVVRLSTLVEALTLLITITYLFAYKYLPMNCMLICLSFAVLFWLFINRAGYISRFLDNKVSSILGRYAYSIFIVHQFILSLTKDVLQHNSQEWAMAHPWLVILFMATGIMIFAILGHHFIEKPCIKGWQYVQGWLSSYGAKQT